MSGKNLASVTGNLGATIANTAPRAPPSVETSAASSALPQPSASRPVRSSSQASALTSLGVLVTDRIRDRKSRNAHEDITTLLRTIFHDTDELRRRLPFAGTLIEEHLASNAPLETLNVDPDDPAYPSIALYKAIVLHKTDTDEKLREILSRLPASNPAPTSSTAPEDESTAKLIDENTSALLYLIGEETQEIRDTLSTHTTALKEIRETLPRLEKKADHIIGQNEDLKDQVKHLTTQNEKLLEAIRQLSTAVGEARQAAPQEDETAIIARAHATLETNLQLPPGTLARELPAFAEKLRKDPHTSDIDKASALFAEKQYAAAETAALARSPAARKPPTSTKPSKPSNSPPRSATAQIQYARAVDHYREAAALSPPTAIRSSGHASTTCSPTP